MDNRNMVALCDMAMKWKQGVMADLGIRDLPPMLAYQVDGSDDIVAVPNEVMAAAMNSTKGDTASAIEVVLKMVPDVFPDVTSFRQIMLVADGYMLESESEAPPEMSLQHDFNTNMDTKVTECLTITVVEDDLVGGCDIRTAQAPYFLDDGGRIEAKEVIYHPEGVVGGRIPEVMREVFLDARQG